MQNPRIQFHFKISHYRNFDSPIKIIIIYQKYMQQQLFETEEIQPAIQGLVITRGGKQTLTKNQQAFNRLTQRIEKLHKDMENKQLQFDAALKIYGREVPPIKIRLTGYQRRLVTILWDVYKSRKLSKTDQRHLKIIIKEHVQELCTQTEGEPDEALKKMYAELEGISFDKMREREKEIMKSKMEDLFDEMEMDIDIDSLDMNDEKAMLEKISEIQQKLFERQEQEQEKSEQPRRQKKLSAKQLEKERLRKAVDELKQKNISTIYKQLAKLFHPDLEQDEERKVEKEVLMKELTAAYETKNLHALLMLELKWIHKENDHLESLSDEKLSIYLEILKEQARGLEHEINGMFQQPRYQVLVQEFGFNVHRMPLEKVKGHLRYLQEVDDSFKQDIENFQSPHCIRYIKAMINQWKAVQRKHNYNEDDDEFSGIIFRQDF